jgi:hypothetical protein
MTGGPQIEKVSNRRNDLSESGKRSGLSNVSIRTNQVGPAVIARIVGRRENHRFGVDERRCKAALPENIDPVTLGEIDVDDNQIRTHVVRAMLQVFNRLVTVIRDENVGNQAIFAKRSAQKSNVRGIVFYDQDTTLGTVHGIFTIPWTDWTDSIKDRRSANVNWGPSSIIWDRCREPAFDAKCIAFHALVAVQNRTALES